jgi:spermidine synthase
MTKRGGKKQRRPATFRWPSRLLPAAFFLSGASALLYELLWFRMLGHIFGSTATAAATLLAAYLFGLGLGAWIFGRISDRSKRLAVIYVGIEAGICLYGLASHALLRRSDVLYGAAHAWAGGDPGLLLASRFAISFLLIVIPTTLMGGTFPLMVQLLRRRHADTGTAAARAYAVNTAGAALGALSLPVFVLPRFGVALSLVTAAGCNVAAAAFVWFYARRARLLRNDAAVDETSSSDEPPLPAVDRSESGGSPGPSAPLLLSGFFLSSFAALSLETVWSRHFGIFFGTQTYTFAFILFAYLVGLFAGGAFYSNLSARGVKALRLLRAGFLVSAASVAVTIPFLDRLPVPQVLLMSAIGVSNGSFIVTSALETLVLIVPPALGFGLAFPAVVGLLAERGRKTGSSVALTYAVNTLGTTLGAIGAGFWLIPSFGTQRTLEISVLLIAAALFLASARNRDRGVSSAGPAPRKLRGVLMSYGVPSVFLLLLLLPRWDWRFAHGMYCKDPVTFVKIYKSGELEEALATYRVPFLSEGTEATVSVLEFGAEGSRSLFINGKPDASSTPEDMVTQRLLGLIPALFHPRIENALVIGLGSGTTAATLRRFPLSKLEVAEIAPGVVKAAKEYFSDINDRFWEDPRVELELDDGRNYLHFRPPNSYDLIVSEPSNPWTAGVSALFTEEFFTEARAKLRPGGVLCQWFHYYNMSLDHIRLLIRTFSRHFPEAAVFVLEGDQPTGDLLLVGAKGELRLALYPDDPTLPEGVRAALDEVKNTTTEHFLEELALGPADLASFAGEGPLNTDDRPILEFEAPADRFHNTFLPNLQALLTATEATFLPAGPPARKVGAATMIAEAGFALPEGVPPGRETGRGALVQNGGLPDSRKLERWVLLGSRFADGNEGTGLFRLARRPRDGPEIQQIARYLAGRIIAQEGTMTVNGHPGIWAEGRMDQGRILICGWYCPVLNRAFFTTRTVPAEDPVRAERIAADLAARYPCRHPGR